VGTIAALALILKLAFGIEIEQVVQAELADILVTLALVVTPIYVAIKARFEKRKQEKASE
jgi:hypothetical protein